MKTLCLTLLLLTGANARASQPTEKPDRYVRTWTDYIDVHSGFSLERSYDSQSLVNGSFGFGWCSELDTSIEPTRDGQLKLLNCKSKRGLHFAAVAPLLAAGGANARRGPDRSPAFSPRGGTFFTSPDSPDVRIELKNEAYELTKNGTVVKRFDGAGRLLEWVSEDGTRNRIKRNVSGDPVSWETGRGLRLSLRAEPGTGRIRSILLPGGSSINYQYLDENLVTIEKDKDIQWSHHYDDLHNLTLSQSPDGFSETILYDKLRDVMVSINRGLRIRK